MSGVALVAATASTAAAAWLLLVDSGAGTRRVERLRPSLRSVPGPIADGHDVPLARADVARAGGGPRPLTAALSGGVAGLAVGVVIGGPVGWLAAVAAAALLPRWLRGLEPRAARHRRERLRAQAPEVADLIAACLFSGSPLSASLAAVAAAVDEPAAQVLATVVARTRLGADQVQAWAALDDEGAFAPVSRAMRRAAESGAPVADALTRSAHDLRARRRGELLAAARVAGVTAVLPLGLCFLPAFALLGIVPVVVSMLGQVLTW